MASNKIKGLTIEIGGDTTKLVSSMGEVNKHSKDLRDELKDVNRLLKLDPTNTELLDQKQKILADSISTTKDRLQQLKEAEKQVQEQVKKGEASEEQYRALQREIIKTEQELQKVETAAKDFSNSMSKGLKEAGNDIKAFGGKVGKAADAFMPVSIGAAGLLTGLYANVEATKDYREEMAKLETAFVTNGHSVEGAKQVYDDFYAVLGEEDRAVEAVSHLAQLTDSQEELSDWATIATGVYATFGDSLPIEGLTEAANETAKTGELTGVLADALNWAGVSEDEFKAKLEATNSEKERSELITETLNGLYGESAEKYREVNSEILEANENQGKMNDSMATLGETLQPLVNDIMKSLTGALQGIAEWVANLDEGTLNMILTVVAVVAAIGPLLAVLSNTITLVGAITGFLPVLGAAFTALAGPIGVAIAAIAGAIAIGVALYKNWDEVKAYAYQLWENIKQRFNEIKEAITRPINEAMDTLRNIDLFEVGKNIISGLINGVKAMVGKVKEAIGSVVDTVTGGVKRALRIESPSKVMEEMGGNVSEGFAVGIKKKLMDVQRQAGEMSKAAVAGTSSSASITNNSVMHSGTIRVEGVNNAGDLTAVVDIVMDQLRREVRTA